MLPTVALEPVTVAPSGLAATTPYPIRSAALV
jgi:hypothetical protein